MGYYADSTACHVHIKKENEEALKLALKEWVASGQKSWISTEQALNQTDVIDLINECRYGASRTDKYICIDYFDGEKWGTTDDEFPYVIAPFVENGGHIEFRGEDDCLWRFLFENKECIEQSGYLEEVWN